jgi:hypothetical protein
MFWMKMKCAVLTGLVAVVLAGCGQPVAEQQVAQEPQEHVDVLAVVPDLETLGVPSEDASVLLDAAGGLSLWAGQKQLSAHCIVKLFRPDASFYLTEHDFVVYPWSNAICVSASEPRSKFVWQVVDGQYALLSGDPSLDVSPLAGSYQGYASAILEIVTTPVRFLDRDTEFKRVRTPERVRGQWYQRFTAKHLAKRVKGPDGAVVVEPYWTDAIYFMHRADALVDTIWLGNPARNEFLVVRGYDYSVSEDRDRVHLRAPTKIEVFRSDAEGTIFERIAEINVKTDE